MAEISLTAAFSSVPAPEQEAIRRLLNIEAVLTEPLDMPHRWEVGISR